MKSHFLFSKQQRSGIFLLLLVIVAVQCLYFFVDFSPEEANINTDDLMRYQSEIDSLRLVEIENNKPKIYPFNPNYITDYKGYTLGMSTEEIDRLLSFRKQNKWVNSVKEFQIVTQVSDSLLSTISPYFQFPEWVTRPNSNSTFIVQKNSAVKTYEQKRDLNTATAQQLQAVNGIGETLSERIIKYRDKFTGGFIADVQLQDIYGLSPEVIERILNDFTVKTPREVRKLNLNTATANELVTIQYIDYEIAHRIIEERTLREGFKSLDELLRVKNFPAHKIEIIKLSLTLE
ncbi:ComEA family DNA-binding protein [Flavobacteriaceae bacterium LMO-SS05]